MDEKITEVTTEPQEVEVMSSQLISFPEGDIDTKLANVDKAFELIEKLRTYALKHLSANTIVNQEGNPYIQENGVIVFDAPFGIFERDVTGIVVKENGAQVPLQHADAFKGTIKAIMYSGIVGSKTLGIEFSFEGGVFIDEAENKFHTKEDFLWFSKKAKANWRGRARRKLLGLDNVTWEELEKHGIKKDDCSSVKRKSSKTAPQTQDEVNKENEMRSKIRSWISEVYGGDKEACMKQLKDLTEFKGRDGAMVAGVDDPKNLTGKRLSVTYGKTKTWYEEQMGGGTKID
jgi:hypothetical protein